MPERARRGGLAVRRFRATVEYDGTEFAGFQSQRNARTVQGELEAALSRLSGGNRQPVMGAGRTDAGVHATGQVIAFTYPGSLSVEALTDALNGTLPPDVAVRDVRRAPAGFNPRYAARYREYRYSIWNGPRSPLRERTALWVRSELDVAAMARAVTTSRHSAGRTRSPSGRSIGSPFGSRGRRSRSTFGGTPSSGAWSDGSSRHCSRWAGGRSMPRRCRGC
jgi:hypothetical protein